jgi:hypothetical protein
MEDKVSLSKLARKLRPEDHIEVLHPAERGRARAGGPNAEKPAPSESQWTARAAWRRPEATHNAVTAACPDGWQFSASGDAWSSSSVVVVKIGRPGMIELSGSTQPDVSRLWSTPVRGKNASGNF